MMEMMYMMMQQLVDNGQKRENDANMVRLNALEMPHFTGKVGEDLYRFVDQISHFLNNYVRPTECCPPEGCCPKGSAGV